MNANIYKYQISFFLNKCHVMKSFLTFYNNFCHIVRNLFTWKITMRGEIPQETHDKYSHKYCLSSVWSKTDSLLRTEIDNYKLYAETARKLLWKTYTETVSIKPTPSTKSLQLYNAKLTKWNTTSLLKRITEAIILIIYKEHNDNDLKF